jgi:hypothetical protein
LPSLCCLSLSDYLRLATVTGVKAGLFPASRLVLSGQSITNLRAQIYSYTNLININRDFHTVLLSNIKKLFHIISLFLSFTHYWPPHVAITQCSRIRYLSPTCDVGPSAM